MTGSHISLFAGVGMTDIAVELYGFKTIATAEILPFCRSVLKQRYPNAWHFYDVQQVRQVHFGPGQLSLKRPLFISGGFPCQDVSSSGTGHGVALGARSGLWDEFERVIDEFRPEYVLIENSPLLRSRGLDTILIDLHLLGYDARWDCIPAASVGAPHIRDRTFVVAWLSPPGNDLLLSDEFAYVDGHVFGIRTPDGKARVRALPRSGSLVSGTLVSTHPQATVKDSKTIPVLGLVPTPTKSDGSGGPGTTSRRAGGKNLRTVIAEHEGNGRLNPEWVEWLMGLPIGWTDPVRSNGTLGTLSWDQEPAIPRTVPNRGLPNRTKRIQALGNGLVWPCAVAAIKMIPDLKEVP